MKLFIQILTIARIEARFFVRYPKLAVAALAVTLIPAIYVLIYLSSVWDPAARTGSLNVALVNLDKGMKYQGQFFNAGSEIAAELLAGGKFGYKMYSDENAARSHVREQ